MKRPTAKAIGLPDVGGEFGSCSVSLMDFTEFDLQRIRSIISYKGVTLHASYTRCKCMGVL
ncbi:SsrA-binding protein [Helicobacter pylori]|uniref:SsrA-binding protein n=1 Tax=Helicobacter pylori TaxID=210 RepID=UPI001E5D94AC|nr:SsrA-binding protein [Helicobacter pylori]